MVFADVAIRGMRNHAPIGFNGGLIDCHKAKGRET
jgi:hypothetical protein